MAIDWMGFARAGGKTLQAGGFHIDTSVLERRASALMRRYLTRCGLILQRQMRLLISVDTGWARAQIQSRVTPSGRAVNVGILFPPTRDGEVAAYPVMQEQGIRRHFLALFDRNGALRQGVYNWMARHGLLRFKSASGRVVKRQNSKAPGTLLSRGMMVWGRAAPWIEPGWRWAQPYLKQEWQALRGRL